MASDASDDDIFDYYDEGSDIDYDDGDSSINDGIFHILEPKSRLTTCRC